MFAVCNVFFMYNTLLSNLDRSLNLRMTCLSFIKNDSKCINICSMYKMLKIVRAKQFKAIQIGHLT